jgi:3-deoxy-D-manno-octulosonate 8-phosphate phosphatase (KDO 8-P phosphatase)
LPSDPPTDQIWDALTAEQRAAFGRVQALVLDVDGVMTDGRIHMSSDGSESMAFHVRDGSGTWMLHKAGLRVGIITGRSTGIPRQRAGALRIDDVVEGCRVKDEGLRELLEKWDVPAEACAYMGDDLLDVPAFRVAGLPICVADATPEIRPFAAYVTRRRGGDGAVREVADLILEGRGLRDAVLDRFLGDDRPGATS